MSFSDTQDREQGPGDRPRSLPPASGVALAELSLDEMALPSSEALGLGNVARLGCGELPPSPAYGEKEGGDTHR